MISKILLILAIVCLSEITFGQDSTHLKDDSLKNAKPKQESDSLKTGVAKPKTDSDSAKRAQNAKLKKEADSIKRVKSERVKQVADSIKRVKSERVKQVSDSLKAIDSLKAVNKKLRQVEDSVAKSTKKTDTGKTIATTNNTNHNEKGKDTSNKISGDLHKGHEQETKAPVWLMITAGVLTLITVLLFFKNRQMEKEDKLRQQMINNYTSNGENLRKYLVKKGLLDPLANYEIKNINDKLEELIDKYIKEAERSESISAELDKLKDYIKESAIVNTRVTPAVADLPLTVIKTELILSAGPRKDTSNNDTELGEDIAGSISMPNCTYFWLLDGTSDTAIIKGSDIKEGDRRYEEHHLFSSRVLAQSIGYFIQGNITQYNPEEIPFDELLTKAGNETAREWEERLNNEQPEKREAILRDIGKGYQLICSTTVIIGCLLENGRFYSLRTGDSKVFPFKRLNNELMFDESFKFASDPTGENDRVTFRLDFDESAGKFIVKQNVPRSSSESTTDVEYVFAFTDGIGRITEAQLRSNNPGVVEIIRQNISRISQKTQDDKTLIILQRIPNNG